MNRDKIKNALQRAVVIASTNTTNVRCCEAITFPLKMDKDSLKADLDVNFKGTLWDFDKDHTKIQLVSLEDKFVPTITMDKAEWKAHFKGALEQIPQSSFEGSSNEK